MADHSGFHGALAEQRQREAEPQGPGEEKGEELGLTFARLQRFYGGDPTKWIHTPMGLIKMYVNAIKQLDAEEALSTAQRVSLGVGSMREDDSRSVIRQLRERAGQRTKAMKLSGPALASIGIGFRIKGQDDAPTSG